MSQNLSGMRNIILFLVIAIVLLTSIYFYSQSNKSDEPIYIGINQWPGYEYLFIAKKEGFFKEAGLNIELVELSSLTEIRRAFEREKICGMTATIVEVLEAYKNSGRVAEIVLITDFSNGADVILGSPQIKSISDLKGKIIGIEPGSLSLYLTYRALELNAIKQSEVTMIPMELHDMTSSLKSGKVDAVTSYPPASITIKKLIRVNQLFDSSEIPGEIMDVIAIDKKIVAKFPELPAKLQQVWARALEYVKVNPDQAYSILVERFPISTEEFKQAMHNISIVDANEQSKFLNHNGVTQQNLSKIGSVVFKNENNRNPC